MKFLKSGKKMKSTPFADFFHSAPSSEKKRLYAHVLEKATKRQQDQIARSKELATTF